MVTLVLGNLSYNEAEESSPQTPLAPPTTKVARGRKKSKVIEIITTNNNEAEKEPVIEPPKTRRGRRKKAETLVVTSESLDDPPEDEDPGWTPPAVRRSPRKNQKGKARRSYMSEVASRATLLDSIDLSSPALKITSNVCFLLIIRVSLEL